MKIALLSLMGLVAVQAGQVHVAFGKNVSELTVAWTTTSEEGTSEVHYGLTADALTIVKSGDVRAFTKDARRTWYTRTASMTGLGLGQTYYYKVGDSVNGFSDVFKVRNRKQTAPFNHLLFGDMGASAAFTLCTACTERSEVCTAKTCEKNTTVGLVSEVDFADMFLHVGDFAYDLASSDGKVGDQFMENIEQIASRVPYMVSHGNHEDSAGSLAHYVERFRSQPSNAVPATFKSANGETTNTLYFSWDYGMVHYISFSTELFHGVKSEDPVVDKKTFLTWLENDLIEANKNRDKSPWILAHGHRPLYSSALGDGADAEVKKALEPLFYKYGVDFAVNGHQHNYERSYPTYESKSQTNYNNPTATIYVVSGAAGSKEMHTPFIGVQPSWSAYRSNTFGYTRMIVYNATHIHWQQVQTDPSDFPLSEYGRVIDDLWIVQASHGPFKAEEAPTEVPQPGSGVTFDHFAPLLKDLDDGSGRPLDAMIRSYIAKNGEVAWAHRLEKLLEHFNHNPKTKAQWEDGLLTKNVTDAIASFQWIDKHSHA